MLQAGADTTVSFPPLAKYVIQVKTIYTVLPNSHKVASKANSDSADRPQVTGSKYSFSQMSFNRAEVNCLWLYRLHKYLSFVEPHSQSSQLIKPSKSCWDEISAPSGSVKLMMKHTVMEKPWYDMTRMESAFTSNSPAERWLPSLSVYFQSEELGEVSLRLPSGHS